MPVLERFSRLSVALCRVMMVPRLAPNGAVLELVAEGEYEIGLGLGLISPKEVRPAASVAREGAASSG